MFNIKPMGASAASLLTQPYAQTKDGPSNVRQPMAFAAARAADVVPAKTVRPVDKAGFVSGMASGLRARRAVCFDLWGRIPHQGNRRAAGNHDQRGYLSGWAEKYQGPLEESRDGAHSYASRVSDRATLRALDRGSDALGRGPQPRATAAVPHADRRRAEVRRARPSGG